MGERWYLAVDLGTGGPKVAAVLGSGEVVRAHLVACPTRLVGGGGAVQDAEAWWTGIREGVREVLGGGDVDPALMAGVGITSQWGSTVPVGDDGRPVGPCLLWSDCRGGPLSAEVVGGPVAVSGFGVAKLARWVRLTGGAPSPLGADPTGHALFLRDRLPDLYERTRVFLEPADYLGLRFSGRAAATPASMILSWLTDNRPGAPLRYDDRLVRLARRDPGRLPPLVPTGSVLGGVLPEVAADLGIPAGRPVVAGIPDLHSAWLGSGAVAPFAGHVTISTSAWIAAAVPFKRTDVLHQIASVPGIAPGHWLIADNHETGGDCLRWLRDGLLTATDGSAPTYDELTAMAATVPAGADGVLFAPWLNGERSPVEDRTLRGSFLNLSLTAERATLARAVLEGVAHNARWLLDAVERFAKRPLGGLRILGGGARSDLWCQIHADVLGRTVEQVEDPAHANLRGAGLFAAIALGDLTLDDVPSRVAVRAVYEPAPAHRHLYDDRHREFTGLYRRQRRMYRRLNGRGRED